MHRERSVVPSAGRSSDTDAPFAAPFMDDYVYRGEGNANLVLSLLREHKVIRFRKSLPDEASALDDDKARVKREVEFVRHVISAYLGSYVQVPEILLYNAEDVAKISRAIRSLRPEKRRHKEIMKKYATKMTDYTFLPTHLATLNPEIFSNKSTFCVEIKPKQGYQRKVEQRLQNCPYCLTQYYKLERKVIKARSSYCPFDLFSGERERIKSALSGLLESPQNNLKIFKDGVVVYDQESSFDRLENILEECFRITEAPNKEERLELFCSLISAALLHPYLGKIASSERNQTKLEYNCLYRLLDQDSKNFSVVKTELESHVAQMLQRTGKICNRETRELPEDCVLARILSLQKLPYVSTKYVYDIYEKYFDSLDDAAIYASLIDYFKRDEEKKKDYASTKGTLTDDFNENPVNKLNFVQLTAVDEKGDGTNSQLNHSSYIYTDCDNETNNFMSKKDLLALQHYLLFCTAKDCSILIVFRQVNQEAIACVPYDYVVKVSEKLCFLTSIGISDLDPKSVHSIAKHRQRDINVLNAVISTMEKTD